MFRVMMECHVETIRLSTVCVCGTTGLDTRSRFLDVQSILVEWIQFVCSLVIL